MDSLWLPGFEFGADLTGPAPLTPIANAASPAQSVATDLFSPAYQPQEVPVVQPSDADVETFDIKPAAPVAGPKKLVSTAAAQERTQCDEPPWPLLDPSVHAGLKGVRTKFDANIDALKLLRELEARDGSPSPAQRDVLNRYTGWGGIKQPFDRYPTPDWADAADSVRALLSDEEFKSAEGSTLNAHYTPLPITKVVWEIVERFGFTGGRVIEPTAGTGYFLGSMPTGIAQRSTVTAVELDTVSARILKALYGARSAVIGGAIEKANLPEEYFDLAISNLPFGRYQVPCQRRKPYSNWTIHNYVAARCLDLVRPGGIVAIITSSYFMDAHQDTVRASIARKAKLLGAVRFPAGTFADIANTDVVTDLVFLQRRHAGDFMTPAERDAWVPAVELDHAMIDSTQVHGPVRVNKYWLDNPGNVLGKWTMRRGAHGFTCVPILKGAEPADALQQRIGQLPAAVYEPARIPQSEVVLEPLVNSDVLPGSFMVENGRIYRFDGVGKSLQNLNGKRASRVAGLVGVRTCLQKIIVEQAKIDADEATLSSLRYELNTRYDGFVAAHGCISNKLNRYAMAKDPTWPLLLSLEHYDEDTDSAEKADIFFMRTVMPRVAPTSADNPLDALAISLAEVGRVDADYIGRLLGRDGKEVILELAATEALYLNPETLLYEESSNYLSGHIKRKLSAAKAAGMAFDRNVRALTAALPRDLLPSEIDVVPGAVWIPIEDLQDFLAHLAGPDWENISWAKATIAREAKTGTWTVNNQGPLGSTMKSIWGTARKTGFELFEKALNQADADVYDQTADGAVFNAVETASARLKQEEIKAEFTRWLWSDEDRANRLARIYNDEYNCWAPRKFDGSRLRLPGYSQDRKLREHQLNGIARVATGQNTLLAHVVGAGKTLAMVCGSMELRRLGIAKKPVHVVPNHMLLQYSAEFLRAYPAASVLMATAEDFDRANRRAFVARCATGDWDAVIITHSMFERIMPDPDATENYIEGIVDELKTAKEMPGIERSAARAVQRALKHWTARLEKLQSLWKKDDLILFSQVGFDHLLIDESHCFKNLFRLSNMKNIAGLSDSNSQRAFDLLLKTKQIMSMKGDKEAGITLATGTPISNTLAELHVSMRYLQPYTLAAAGLDSFDNWAAQHGRAVNSMEVSPDGSSFRMNRRFKLFANVPEMMGLWRQVADIQTKEMLNLPTPPLLTGAHQICVAQQSPELKQYVEGLVKRADRIRNGAVSPAEDNMLAVTGDGRKAALDLRMVMASALFDANGKIAKCVDNVHRIYEKTAHFKGTQIIFADLGTPTGKGFNAYEDIRQRLIARGVPAHEIAFIHEAKTDVAKATLFAKVRSGAVRVLLGSTSKCGTGTNVQTRLYAAHHLDSPWRPSDVEQRDGRIERQGNTCDAIEIWRYVTEGSFDSFMWQGLVAKATFIAQVMSGNAEIRTVEDAQMAALSYDEVKAIACGNPVVREKAMLDAEIMQLSLKERQWRDTVWRAKSDLRKLPHEIESARRNVASMEAFQASLEADEGKALTLEVAGKLYSDADQVSKIITLSIAASRERAMPEDAFALPIEIGKIKGGRLVLLKRFGGDKVYLHSMVNNERWEIGSYISGASILKKLGLMKTEMQTALATLRQRVTFLEGQAPVLAQAVASDFGHALHLKELRERSMQIALELGLLKDAAGTANVSASAVATSEVAKQLAQERDEEELDAGADVDLEAEALLEIDW